MALKRRGAIIGVLLGALILVLPYVTKWRVENQRRGCFETLRQRKSPVSEYRRVLGPPTDGWIEADGSGRCEVFRVTPTLNVFYFFKESSGLGRVETVSACAPTGPFSFVDDYLTGVQMIFSPERCEAALREGP